MMAASSDSVHVTPQLLWPFLGNSLGYGGRQNTALKKGNEIMAKGMTKRRRDEKKPKKEVVKVIAAAPSMKNAVAINTPKTKTK